jgi:hypothetical protein
MRLVLLLALHSILHASDGSTIHSLRRKSISLAASNLANIIVEQLFLQIDQSSPSSTQSSSFTNFLDIAPKKLTNQQFQKVMNAGGGDVEPGTEGFDPYTATMEPNDKCRTEANKYRSACLFGSAFNNDKP